MYSYLEDSVAVSYKTTQTLEWNRQGLYVGPFTGWSACTWTKVFLSNRIQRHLWLKYLMNLQVVANHEQDARGQTQLATLTRLYMIDLCTQHQQGGTDHPKPPPADPPICPLPSSFRDQLTPRREQARAAVTCFIPMLCLSSFPWIPLTNFY